MLRFRGPRCPPRFVSRSLRSRKVRGCRPGQGHCSAGDPIAGLLSRGHERDLPGSQAVRPVPLPRSRTRPNRRSLASLTVSSMLSPRFPRRRLQRLMNFGALSRGFGTRCLRFKKSCCHHPCKARFRLAGLAFAGKESNSLDRYKRVQITVSSSFSGFNPGAREISASCPPNVTECALGRSVCER